MNLIFYLNLSVFFVSKSLVLSKKSNIKCEFPPFISYIVDCLNPLEKCDSKSTSGLGISSRIIGGTNADLGDAPYQCGILGSLDQNPFGPICGAVIYNKTTLITAAHCAEVIDTKKAGILCNTLKFCRIPAGFKARKIKNVIIHPNYKNNTAENDIALLILEESLTFNKNTMKPADLLLNTCDPSKVCTSYSDGSITCNSTSNCKDIGTNARIMVSGWGLTSNGLKSITDIQPACLQKLYINLVEREDCKIIYKSDNNSNNLNYISNTMICAGGYANGGKDICSGDSGGPLVIKTSNGKNYLCGIVSKGTCGQATYPGVYTLVPLFDNFIKYNATN